MPTVAGMFLGIFSFVDVVFSSRFRTQGMFFGLAPDKKWVLQMFWPLSFSPPPRTRFLFTSRTFDRATCVLPAEIPLW